MRPKNQMTRTYTSLAVLTFFTLFSSIDSNAQVANPYLQTPTSSSIWVSWKTSEGTESTVEYGLSEDHLDMQATGSIETMASDWIWHKTKLTSLSPNTAYYYRVKTGDDLSDVKRFKTQPVENTSTGHYRFILMGDHQRNIDNRYEVLVKAAKAKAESKYGIPVEDHINLIVNAGDQVNTGTSLSEWENIHFAQGAPLTGNIPSITVVGNHDQGGGGDGNIATYSKLFTYKDDTDFHYADLAGTHGNNYYAFQVANIVFACFNSNQSWSDQADWAQQVADQVKSDSNIEWFFGDAHHPILAEQLPGDASSYMRSSIVPKLNSSGKLAMYISGHAHLYARGALRDDPVYHVINGGASWDQYWGQYGADTDFADVQKTIERQIFQIIDLNLDTREMSVETYSIGTSLSGGFDEDKLIDSYYLKLDAPTPTKPTLQDIPSEVTLPYTFKGNVYEGQEPNNSSEFQFAGADGDFGNPSLSVKRDFENIYSSTGAPNYTPIDSNEGVDIFSLEVADNQLTQGSNSVRIRYRDKSMHWSEWSDPIEFTTTNGLEPPIKDPIAYFPLDENVKDESTSGKDFDNGINSTAQFVNDDTRGGNVADFSNDIITLQEGSDAKDGLPANHMTVATWVRVDASEVWGGYVGLVQDNGNTEQGWLLGGRDRNFSFALSTSGSSTLTYLRDTENFTLGQWYHVVGTYNGNEMKLYVNGVKKSSADKTGDIHYPPSGWFQIGSYKDNDEDHRLDGRLDDIFIWERALSDAEILDMYENENVVIDSTPPLVQSFAPANESSDIAINATLSVSFNEAIETGTGELKIIEKETDNVFATYSDTFQGISTSEKTATIQPDVVFDNVTSYYITYPEGFFKDLAGNPIAALEAKTDWAFTTTTIAGLSNEGNNPVIYPNPSKHELNIQSGEKGVFHLISIKGELLWKKKVSVGKNTIRIPKRYVGMFIARLQGETKTSTEKLILEQ